MKIKLLVGALVLLIIINLAAIGAFLFVQSRAPHPVMAPPPIGAGDHPEGAFEPGPPRGPMADLSPLERRRLFETQRAFREDARPLIEETRRLEDELVAAMNRSPAPRARIDSLLQQISAKRLEIARRATDRMIAMGDSLSAEERERLTNAIVRMRAGEGPGGPPPRERVRRWRGGQQN